MIVNEAFNGDDTIYLSSSIAGINTGRGVWRGLNDQTPMVHNIDTSFFFD